MLGYMTGYTAAINEFGCTLIKLFVSGLVPLQ